MVATRCMLVSALSQFDWSQNKCKDMTTQLTTKLRLVRCPKCLRLLPEVANVPVYKCGGCGTVLRAKKCKIETKDTGLHKHEPDNTTKNEVQHSQEETAQISSQEEALSSTGEMPLDKKSGSDQNEAEDSKREQSGDAEFSSIELSTGLTRHRKEESSQEARAEIEVDQQHKCSSEQNKEVDQNEHQFCNVKQNGGVGFSEDDSELHHLESDKSSLVAGDGSDVVEKSNSWEQNNGGDQNEHRCWNGKETGGVSFSVEVALSSELSHHESDVDEDTNCLEQHNGRNQIENENQLGEVNFSEEVASSPELNHHGAKESSSVAHSDVDEDTIFLEQQNGRNQSEHEYCNENQPAGVNFSDEVASSTELNHHDEESSPVAGARSVMDENRSYLEQGNEINQNEHGDCSGNQPGCVNFSYDVASSTELNHHGGEESSPVAGAHHDVDENRNCLEQGKESNQNEHGNCNGKEARGVNFSNAVPSSTELTSLEIEVSSPDIGPDREMDGNLMSRISESSTAENLGAARPRDSVITAQKQSGESLTDNVMSPHVEQLKQPTRAPNVSSLDTLENIALANSSSEFSVSFRDMPKSPTTRSNYAYDYDGSVSSYDGTEDKVPDQHRHLPKRKFKKAEFGSPTGKQYFDWNCSSIPSEKKHNTMRGSKWHQDELLGPKRHDYPVRNQMRFESGECLSRVPFNSRISKVGYERGSPPSYYGRKALHSPLKPGKPEEEKIKLLKMVYELQGELNRTRVAKGKAYGVFPGVSGMENRIPSFYGQDVEICCDSTCTRCPGRCNQGKIQPHQSRIPFSAQIDHACFHCCPPDWHSPGPLPLHSCCNKTQYTAHPCHRHNNLHLSSPSSPQHYTGFDLSLQRCGKSDDYERKRYSRERNQVKRHVQPTAGGAPFLICYSCSKVLKLPSNFLIFRRKCHKLKCSACSVILKFSLQNRTRVVPYSDFTPEAVAPPPSEVDDCGPSSSKTYSLETDPFSVVLPLHNHKRGYGNRKMSSGSSFGPVEEREKQATFKGSQNRCKNPGETNVLAGLSPKMSKAEKLSSGIEGSKQRLGSPLHRLMGYNSPNAVYRK